MSDLQPCALQAGARLVYLQRRRDWKGSKPAEINANLLSYTGQLESPIISGVSDCTFSKLLILLASPPWRCRA